MSSLTVNGGDFRIDATSPATADKVTVLGATAFNGPSTITPTTTPLPGTYVLLTSTNVSGTAPTLNTPAGGNSRATFSLDFDTTLDQIRMLVTGTPKSLTWTGANGPAWDVNTTTNWTDGAINEKFFNLVLERWGALPYEVVVVGDSLLHDIKGGLDLGSLTVHCSFGATPQVLHDNAQAAGTIMPDATIDDLSQLPALVQAWA